MYHSSTRLSIHVIITISLLIFASYGLNTPNRSVILADAGINVATEAYEAVCWYEFLKHYIPRTRSLDFNQCHNQAAHQRKTIFKHGAEEKYFGQFLVQHAMRLLPREYSAQCNQYLLQDRFTKFFRDYSKVFGDLKKHSSDFDGATIPYDAFSHCLLSIVQEKYGDAALIKIGEKLASRKNWSVTMFERENEFRILHGVQNLRIHDELTYRAQKWADQLARSCQMYHIHSSHPDYLLNGSRMGENLFTGDNIHSPREDMALFGTNIWYEEIIYYPWPEYKGYGSEPFAKFSHFSQMIWKDTKMVGYGFATNTSESCGRYFIVSRYFPPGNFWGQFADNIKPLVGPTKKTFSDKDYESTRFTTFANDESITTTVKKFEKNL